MECWILNPILRSVLATQNSQGFPSPIQESQKQSADFLAGVWLLRFLLGECSIHTLFELYVWVDVANITWTNVNNLCSGCGGVGIAGEARLPWKCSEDFSSLVIKIAFNPLGFGGSLI